MPKKVILDVDPGIVDAMVLCLAPFDPTVEIVALTSVGGNVPADVAARNLQVLLEFIDPPRLPRIGIGSPPDEPISLDYRHVHGIDGLGGALLPIDGRLSSHSAEKVICDAVNSDPENVMIICLGPLTNIARAAARDPKLPEKIRHICILGGAINGQGNITPCAEFNIYADIQSARTVFRLPCTKTLVPLDVTNSVLLTASHLSATSETKGIPQTDTKLGGLLHKMLKPALWAYRQSYGLEGIHIHDLIAYMVAVHPSWGTTEDLSVQIETEGYFTRGMTIADQRPTPELSPNIEVVTRIKEKTILRAIFQGLHRTAKQMGAGNG